MGESDFASFESMLEWLMDRHYVRLSQDGRKHLGFKAAIGVDGGHLLLGVEPLVNDLVVYSNGVYMIEYAPLLAWLELYTQIGWWEIKESGND